MTTVLTVDFSKLSFRSDLTLSDLRSTSSFTTSPTVKSEIRH